MQLTGSWEFWPDVADIGEQAGVFLLGGGTGVVPYWAAGWPGYAQAPAPPVEWREIAVPGHWQAQGYPDHTGPGWYRLRFTPPADGAGHPFIEFGGVDFYADVWLNGDYLGFHEGDFEPFAFDVGGLLRPGQENLLVVRVAAPLDARPEHKQMPKGGTYHWDALPVRQGPAAGCPEVPSAANPQYPNPVQNPAGIWRPVSLTYRPDLYVSSVRVLPALTGEVTLTVEAENYTDAPVTAPLRTVIMPHNFGGGGGVRHPLLVTLPVGRSAHTFTVKVKNPALWWSWDLGFPHLYKLLIMLGGEQPQAELCFGFREFTRGDDWALRLNGKRFFARGTNYLSDRFLSAMTPERYAEDVRLIREANMNMVRVFAHLEQPEFYKLCDEQGILLWQDLPFQWGYDPSGLFIQRACSLAKAAVRAIHHHPSVVLLCAHSESRIHDFNKLDEALLRAVSEVDRSRPVVKSSVLTDMGRAPRRWETLQEQKAYTAEHVSVLWAGWYWGSLDDIEAYDPPFLTEFGTQSLPDEESLPEAWPPDWEAYRERGFQKEIYEKNLGPVPDTRAELVRRSQEYQCRFYKRTIEALRRKKYRSVNGLLQFLFADNWPAITWSVIDYYRRPKQAYRTVAEAFSPVLLTFTFHPDEGEAALWVVNDRHEPLVDCRVRHSFGADVAIPFVGADSAGVLARIPLPAGAREFKAELVGPKGEVLSRWDGEVVPYVVPTEIERPSIV